MERLRKMKPRRLAFFAVLLVGLSILLAFFLQDVVREVVVLPLSYLFYLFGILIAVTPQIFFWLAIILISFWIAYRSLARRKKPAPPVGGTAWQDQVSPQTSGRLMHWAVKVNVLRRYRSSYYQGGFHQSLVRLLIEMLAHRYRLTNPQVEDRIRRGEIDLPPEVQEYAMFSLRRPGTSQMSFFRRVWEDFLETIRIRLNLTSSKININTLAARATRRVENVIEYMEEELEVQHEHASE